MNFSKQSEKVPFRKELKEYSMVAKLEDRKIVKNPWHDYPEGDHGCNASG